MDLSHATLSDLATMRDRNVGAVREAANAELERRAGVTPTAPDPAPDTQISTDAPAQPDAAEVEAERKRLEAELAALPPEPVT